MSIKLNNVRGTKDLFGQELESFSQIVTIAQKISNFYGFAELLTPIFEFSEVFERNLGNSSDIISKEVYKFPDRGNNSLTLRPEFTAAIVRSFIANSHLNNILPAKLFSYGPIFRYDRPQKGRQRQFHQINFEIFGIDSIYGDVEAILVCDHLLRKLAIKDRTSLQINSLGSKEVKNKYELALKEYFFKYKDDLSLDSQVRLEKNPLRILDSKDKKDQDINSNSPVISDFYCNSSEKNFNNILQKLNDFKINYEVNPKLVRGLDYYTSTVFEFTTNDLGAQNAVLAGGRYDDLVKKMGGNDVPAIGFAAGIERLMLLSNLKQQKQRPVSIIYISQGEFNYSLELLNKLRNNEIYADISYNSSLKKQWKKVQQNNAKYAIIIGDEEVKSGIIKLKHLDSGEQINLQEGELIATIIKNN